MAIHYCDADNGNDANGGTSWEDAKQTLQSAISLCVGANDVLNIKGTYSVSEITGPSTSYPTFSIVGHDGASIHAGNQSTRVAEVLRLESLTLTSAGTGYWSRINTYVNCIINTDNNGWTFHPASGFAQNIVYCTINTTAGISSSFTNGIFPVALNSTFNGGIHTPNTADRISKEFINCRFIDTTWTFNQGNGRYLNIANCSFINSSLTLTAGGGLYDQRCKVIDTVFVNTTLTAFNYINGFNLYSYGSGSIQDFKKENPTTLLTQPPYSDPENGVWSLSDEMIDITISTGSTPGAIQSQVYRQILHPLTI